MENQLNDALHGKIKPKSTVKALLVLLLALFIISGFMPEGKHRIPVFGASDKDWNPASFWYTPWGRSGVHKGIDIFAKEGTPVVAATSGLVVYSGTIEMGGNVVLIWGGKWRFYYYAHLQSIAAQAGQWCNAGDVIGTVGKTGNAVGKPPHLHFAIYSLLPQLNQYDSSLPQAWKKVFYINPDTILKISITL